MKNDKLTSVGKVMNQIKQKNDVLLEELEKVRKTSFEYNGEIITAEYNDNTYMCCFVFSNEKRENRFVISYDLNELVCFHPDWKNVGFLEKFKADEIEKALQFGFDKIMFPDCSSRTFENAQGITYEEIDKDGLLESNSAEANFWWFMPTGTSYSYVGDWDDMNPILGGVHKIFSGVENGFGEVMPPYIGKFTKEHPCCQTSLAVVYDIVTPEGEESYMLPLHKLDSNDLKALKDIVSLVSKVPIKIGGSRKEYLGEFWSCGPNDQPGGSGVWLYE